MGILAILTAQTCGDACWHAKEETCHCSCGGANHGILNRGGARPERTSRIGGRVFVIAAIAPDYRATYDAVKAINISTDYPDYYNPSAWSKHEVVVVRKASKSQLKWPEVAAVAPTYPHRPEKYIVWRLAAGEPYPKDTAEMKAARIADQDAKIAAQEARWAEMEAKC